MGEPYELYGEQFPMVSHFLYVNGSKRYIAPGDVSVFMQLLHTTSATTIISTTTTSATTNYNNTNNATTTTNDHNSSSGSAHSIRMIPQNLLHAIPTVRWHETIDHMESIAST